MPSGAEHSPRCPSTPATLPGSCQPWCDRSPKALLLLWLWDSAAAPCSALAQRRVTPLTGLREQWDKALSLPGVLPRGGQQPSAAFGAELPLHCARSRGWVLAAQSLLGTPERKAGG